MTVSPLDHETRESFLYSMWRSKREQIDAWEHETGTPAPWHLWEQYNELGEKWRNHLQAQEAGARHHSRYSSLDGLLASPEWAEILRETEEMGRREYERQVKLGLRKED